MDLVVQYHEETDSATVRWYPAYPEQGAGFEIRSYDTSGELRVVESAPREERSALIRDVKKRSLSRIEVHSLNRGRMAPLETTLRQRFAREKLLAADVPYAPVADSRGSGGQGFEGELINCDANNFPLIKLVVRILSGGQPVAGLTEDDFVCTENGTVQDVRVLEPSLADIVFLIDTSGGMKEEIPTVKNSVQAFADLLTGAGVDLRLGLVRFGQEADDGLAHKLLPALTSDVELFKDALGQIPDDPDGGIEPGFEAIRLAISEYEYDRPSAPVHFILITDEDSDDRPRTIQQQEEVASGDPEKQQTRQAIDSNNIVVHAAVCTTPMGDCRNFPLDLSCQGCLDGEGTFVDNALAHYCDVASIRTGLLLPVRGFPVDPANPNLGRFSRNHAPAPHARRRSRPTGLPRLDHLVLCRGQSPTRVRARAETRRFSSPDLLSNRFQSLSVRDTLTCVSLGLTSPHVLEKIYTVEKRFVL